VSKEGANILRMVSSQAASRPGETCMRMNLQLQILLAATPHSMARSTPPQPGSHARTLQSTRCELWMASYLAES
jgi:hypothetical protein